MSGPRPNTFKVVQLNAENLFLFLDDPGTRDWKKVSEKEWQKLSRATIPNKSLSKTLWLAESLLEMDADIVCLNEVGGEESIQNFNRHFLGGRYKTYLIEGNSDRGIDVGFLVHKDLDVSVELRTHKNRPIQFLYPHEIQSNEHFAQVAPEKVKKSHFFSRDCAELRLFSNKTNKPSLIVLGVHLKSKLDPDQIDPEGRLRRQAEVRTLTEIYKEVRAEFEGSVPVMVMGDFNGSARRSKASEEFLHLTETDLESVIEVAGLEGEAAATQLQFNRSGQMLSLEIDFIFISPDLKPKLVSDKVEIFRYRSDLKLPLPLPQTFEQRLQLPSDHYPVVATFQRLF